MIRFRNMSLDVFIQRQHTRTILRKNMGLIRFRNVELGVFRQHQHKSYFKKEKYVAESF